MVEGNFKAQEERSSVLHGTAVVGSLTLMSRILGFVRELLIARLFGAGIAAESYFVAFRIPNLLRSIFAEGAFTTAFVPVFASELVRGKQYALKAFRSIATLLLIATVGVSILGILVASLIVDLIAPGFSGERFELCVRLTQVMMPYICFVSLVALINGALNSVNVFGASAWAQVAMNLVLILATIIAEFLDAYRAVFWMAWSVLIGGGVQIFVQLKSLKNQGFNLLPTLNVFSTASRRVLTLMVPALFGAVVYQISIFLTTQLASLLPQGSVAWLSYADRVAQLPIGVFTIALSSVLLPKLALAHAREDSHLFKSDLSNALRYASFVMITLSAFLFSFSFPLVSLLFERGNFDAQASLKTAIALEYFALGLWPVSCHSLVVRAFNSRHNTKTPTKIGILSLVLTVIFSVALMGPIDTYHHKPVVMIISQFQGILFSFAPFPNLGHAGLALASSLSFLVSATCISLLFAFSYRGMCWDKFFAASWRSLLSSVLASCAIGLLSQSHILSQISLWILVWATSMALVRSREFFESIGLLIRRFC